MDIELKKSENTLTIVIDGNIDSEGGQKLSAKFQEIAEMNDIKNIILDLTTVITTTSSGIGKILNFFKHIDANGGSMEINGISDSLYNQFMEIHLNRIFPIKKVN